MCVLAALPMVRLLDEDNVNDFLYTLFTNAPRYWTVKLYTYISRQTIYSKSTSVYYTFSQYRDVMNTIMT